MNYVNEQNMQEILDGIARKIGQGGTGAGLEDWQSEHTYSEKDICVYEGQIYRAKVGFTSDTTFSTIQILEEYTPVGGETIIPYEKDTEISTNDIVSYDNNTYKALYNFVCGEEFSLYALQEYVPQELTEDDIKQIIDAYNPVFEEAKGIEYSTEERRIGTWIDGKPLYQKTYSGTIPSGANSGNVNFFEDSSVIGNADMIFVDSGYIIDQPNYGIVHSLNTADFPDKLSNVFISTLYNTIRGRVVDRFVGQPIVVTIKYTKTTDEGGGT